MKRLITLVIAAAALPLAAQQAATTAPSVATAPPAANGAAKIVATINGESITQEKLDFLYGRLGTQLREQYEKNGGKQAFLENYLRKRLLVQEALKAGFDKRPDVQADMEASRESTLFDRYVRDVVAARLVSDAEIKKYYDENPKEFALTERVKVRHIVVVPNGAGPHPKSKEQALELIKSIYAELHQKQAETLANGADEVTQRRLLVAHFADAARRYSEDGVAQQGGDLGWNEKGVFDPDFEAAAFKLQPGQMSGIVETKFGYHLILVEDTKPAGTESLDEAKPKIREFLMATHAADVMEEVAKLTNELRNTSRISVYPENIR